MRNEMRSKNGTRNDNGVETLNKLVIINNDRIEGYKTAVDATDEPELKTLFSQFLTTSQKCKAELEMKVKALGGKIADGTKTSGKFFRAWIDVKAAFTSKDRKSILNSCDTGEEKAGETYESVITNDFKHLDAKQKNMVRSQKSMLRTDHDQIIAMRNALDNA